MGNDTVYFSHRVLVDGIDTIAHLTACTPDGICTKDEVFEANGLLDFTDYLFELKLLFDKGFRPQTISESPNHILVKWSMNAEVE